MALDWGILHWIQNNITCPFLDAVVPKLTMLGNAGIIWILAGVLLLCTKKYRRQGALVLMGLLAGLLVGNVALKHLGRALAALLARSLRAAFDRHADGLLVPLGTHAVLDDRRDDPDEDRPAFRLCCHSARGAHRLSRLYLYVHFPSDVFSAALLGLLIGELTFRYGGKLLDKISRRQKQ